MVYQDQAPEQVLNSDTVEPGEYELITLFESFDSFVSGRTPGGIVEK